MTPSERLASILQDMFSEELKEFTVLQIEAILRSCLADSGCNLIDNAARIAAELRK
jgi:hypothetical protein